MQNHILKKWSNIQELQESKFPTLPSYLVDTNKNIEKQITDFKKQNAELDFVIIRYDNDSSRTVKSSSPIIPIKNIKQIQEYILEGITQGHYPIITGAIAEDDHILAINVMIVSKNELLFELAFNTTAYNLSKGKINPDIVFKKGCVFEFIKGDISQIDIALIEEIEKYIKKYLTTHQNATNKNVSLIISRKSQIFCTNLYDSSCWN